MTPVVGFSVGGVAETIGEGMGEVVQPFDVPQLLEKVLYWSEKKKSIAEDVLQARSAYCKKERMVSNYMQLYGLG